MQINFYMGDQDRELFHQYIFSRGGYLTSEFFKKTRFGKNNVPIASSENLIEFEQRTLKIFLEKNFSKDLFAGKDWLTYSTVRKSYFVNGPGMQYDKSHVDKKGIHRGRIYMGLVSPSSYLKPDENYADHHKPVHREKYKEIENFYKSCCRYIRKNFRRDSAGFYHGMESDSIESCGIKKLQF